MSLKLIDHKPLSFFILHLYKREKWLQVVSDVEGGKFQNENLHFCSWKYYAIVSIWVVKKCKILVNSGYLKQCESSQEMVIRIVKREGWKKGSIANTFSLTRTSKAEKKLDFRKVALFAKSIMWPRITIKKPVEVLKRVGGGWLNILKKNKRGKYD